MNIKVKSILKKTLKIITKFFSHKELEKDFIHEKILALPPEKRTIIVPAGGWKPQTVYWVLVAFNKNNPIHYAIFYSGFLNGKDKAPGGYNSIFAPTHNYVHHLGNLHFLEVVKELDITFNTYSRT